jgi:Signal peptidase I
MENTLEVGDRVLVNKVVYHFRGIARGDIVVFSGQDSWGPDAPPPSSNPVVRVFDDVLSGLGLHSDQTYYIKRVIGLPGDHGGLLHRREGHGQRRPADRGPVPVRRQPALHLQVQRGRPVRAPMGHG